MKQMPRAARVMTPFPYSLDATAGLEEAQAMMREHGFRHIPVKRGETVLGVVTERDVYKAMATGNQEVDMGTLVGSDPYIVQWNTPLNQLARVMAEKKLGSTVVVRQGKLAGIVTTTDICEFLASFLDEQFAPDGGEDDVAE